MLNVKDLLKYTNKINAAIDDAMANNGTQDSPAVDELISYYTGPGTAGNRSLLEHWRKKALHRKRMVRG